VVEGVGCALRSGDESRWGVDVGVRDVCGGVGREADAADDEERRYEVQCVACERTMRMQDVCVSSSLTIPINGAERAHGCTCDERRHQRSDAKISQEANEYDHDDGAGDGQSAHGLDDDDSESFQPGEYRRIDHRPELRRGVLGGPP